MSLAVKGRITKVLSIETGTSKAGKEWKKQSFVLDTGAQYNPEVCFSLFGDEKVDMLRNYGEGQEVEVAFNVSSREFNGKYYHNLDAWKINTIGAGAPSGGAAPAPAIDDAPAGDDDLPF
tara:strand:- start:6130 stop:6489 length:360 start_codon:yes stop_codon:yes gene_type:complete